MLISWECTIAHAVPWATFEPWLAKEGEVARFLAAISAASVAYEKERGKVAGWLACDLLAVAAAIRPHLIQVRLGFA